VTNQKAGFSFKVPDGWSIDGNDSAGQFWLTLLSPDAVFSENDFFINGCRINVAFASHSDFIAVDNIRAYMVDGFENQEIIVISNYNALKTTNVPNDIKISEKTGATIKIEIPVNQKDFVTIFTHYFSEEICSNRFQEFLLSFSIN